MSGIFHTFGNMLIALPVAAIIVIAVSALAPKTGVAAPLILVAIGIVISLIPGFPHVEVEPELILAGVMPPLLYAAAVSLPAMDFRRDFAAISGLSVVLIIVSAVVLGLIFRALIPALAMAGGIALGAIISPTDAEATSIVKNLGAPSRVITVLEGEGLLNHATSMLLLNTAIAATVGHYHFGHFAGIFAWAAVGGVAFGLVAGFLGLIVRKHIHNPALNTAVSFVVPFVAFIPAEESRSSGLVAVVVAGLVTGIGAAKYLTPQDRFFEHANWSTVEKMVSGGLFLVMGLQLAFTMHQVQVTEDHPLTALWFALLAILVVSIIRALFIVPLLWNLNRIARIKAARRLELSNFQSDFESRMVGILDAPNTRINQFRAGLTRRISDADYFTSHPLGRNEGVLLIWAGMRGVITLAAAQILPEDFPHRALLVLIAFIVGVGSLTLRGGTLPALMRRLGLTHKHEFDPAADFALHTTMETTARTLLNNPNLRRPDGEPYDAIVVHRLIEEIDHSDDPFLESGDPKTVANRLVEYQELRLRTLNAQRAALLEIRAQGTQDSELLTEILNTIDVQQIALEMHA